VRTYLTFLYDTNFTVYSLVHKVLTFFGISRLSVMVYEDKGFYVLLFLTVRDNSVMT
jgi:hypothetical protein